MLGRRLASAAVIISVLIGLIYFDFQLGTVARTGKPGIVLAVLAVIVAVLAAGELAHLLKQLIPAFPPVQAMLIVALTAAICCVPVLQPATTLSTFMWLMIGLIVAVTVTMLIEVVRYRRPDPDSAKGVSTLKAIGGIAIAVLIVLLIGFFVAHRLLDGHNALGLLALLALITTVKMSDAAAYFTGRSLGTVKLAPVLSPGKTLQGAVGGIFGGCVGAAIVFYAVAPWFDSIEIEFPIWWSLIYGTAVSSAGILGDLTVSMFKRDAGLKDSSSWVPGLGGILDITDSLVFAAPLSWLIWRWLLGLT